MLGVMKKAHNFFFNFFLNSYNFVLKKILGYEIAIIRKQNPGFIIDRILLEFYTSIYVIDGDIVECGVGEGTTFLSLVYLAKLESKGRKIWGFDSFEGFPEPSIYDKSPRNPKKGEWNLSNIINIKKRLINERNIDPTFIKKYVRLIKGFFNESLEKYDGGPIALLHLDVDLYESYKVSLEQLWPKVAKGGIVLFDEYKLPSALLNFPGASKAIDEFFGDLKSEIKINQFLNKYYIIKL